MVMTTNVKIETEILIERMTNEEYGYSLTDKVNEAIYILHDGRMISGMEEGSDGVRTVDHRMIECAFDDMDRYTPGFWDTVHSRFEVVRMVPEAKVALIKVGQQLNNIQKLIIGLAGYKVEEY